MAKQRRTNEPAAVSSADELRELLERAIEQVLDNIDKHGWSIPMCLAHSPASERIYVVADSSDPDAEHDPKKSAESILLQVRRMIKKKELRSIAFARHVHLTVSSDQGPVESDAVKVLLDHEAGDGSTAFLLYHIENGKATPDELFYEELQERFFTG